MKITVSIDDELFRRAEEDAAAKGLNRSQLYAEALTTYLRPTDDEVTAAINAALQVIDPDDPEQQSLDRKSVV